MKKLFNTKNIITLLLCLVAMAVQGSPISKNQATQIAKDFLRNKGITTSSAKMIRSARRSSANTNAAYYVFNGEQRGFVIVAGDDRIPTVLGYSTTEDFSTEEMPDNMKAFMQGIVDQLNALDTNEKLKARAMKTETIRHAASPFVKSTWNQGAPFNNNCPLYRGERTVTGCVATAMAQALYYFKQPSHTTSAIPSYSSKSHSLKVSGIDANSVIDWENMVDHYYGSETEAQNTAVANLMDYVGRAVRMDYDIRSKGGSGTSSANIAPALKTYFGFDAQFIERANMNYSDFEDAIYNEVYNKRPVIFGGQSTGGGHSFIIDGYDGKGLFHVNWGWGGTSNGYFLLSVLNPDNTTGIGASTSSDGFSMVQDAVIGLRPLQEGEQATASTLKLSMKFIDAYDNYVKFSMFNNSGETHDFDFGIGYLKDGEMQVAKSTIVTNLGTGYGYNEKTFQLYKPTEGTHRLYCISRVKGTSEWYYNENDYVYATVTSDGKVSCSMPTTLAASDFVVKGNKRTGEEQKIDITISNTSDKEFYGPLYLYANEDLASMTGATVPAYGETTVTMNFTPTTATDYTLNLTTDQSGTKSIGGTTVTISGESTEGAIQLLATASGESQQYGKTIKGTITVNNDSSTPYYGNITLAIFNESGKNSGQQDITVSIDGKSYTTVPFAFNNMSPGNYTLNAFCYYNDKYNYIYGDLNCTLSSGVIIVNFDGTEEAVEMNNDFVTPSQALSLDFSDIESSVTSIIPNSNPNTLYIFKTETAAAKELKETNNVIVDGHAENINLTDGSSFYAPISFTADNITYNRKPQIGITKTTESWETFALPFEATEVWVDNQKLDWFHSAEDSGKDFWLMYFNGTDGNHVKYEYAGEKISAEMPYIIAVPGNKWGEQYSLVGKTMSFKGSGEVKASLIPCASYAQTLDMMGNFQEKEFANEYSLNENGTAFELKENATINAFRAYIHKNTNAVMDNILTISIAGDETTGISKLNISDSASLNDATSSSKPSFFNLSGQKVNKNYKGIVINNNRKQINK